MKTARCRVDIADEILLATGNTKEECRWRSDQKEIQKREYQIRTIQVIRGAGAIKTISVANRRDSH